MLAKAHSQPQALRGRSKDFMLCKEGKVPGANVLSDTGESMMTRTVIRLHGINPGVFASRCMRRFHSRRIMKVIQ